MAKIAIIGSGISGLGAASLLHKNHDITIFEKNDYIGGHTRTRTVDYDGKQINVDTGFIVFNYRNYPYLSSLFKHLSVPVEKSVMSFGVTSTADDLEWGAENPMALFGQRRNLWRPDFYKFLFDIFKFNARARSVSANNPGLTLQGLLDKMGLGEWFARFYILPMGGAIWSCPLAAILEFPAQSFIDFFDAHGLLTVTDQPQWYTVTGGSAEYVKKLTAPFADRIDLSRGARIITRENDQITIQDSKGNNEHFDRLVLSCHADEALSLLADATPEEKETLGAFRYQKNTAVLHRYIGIMPKNRPCWSSWVYHADAAPQNAPIAVTYWMNHLQNLDKNYPLFVTLNPRTPIPEDMIFERHEFMHPIYDQAAVTAQDKLVSLQGQKNTWFCGAYHKNGFHEDGLSSAVSMIRQMGLDTEWA